jgi:hypothetical protein
MRVLPTIAVLGAAMFCVAAGRAQAAPAGFDWSLGRAAASPVVAVQWECSPVSCIDSSTGAYTQSGCNGSRCYPTSGVIGYTDPGQAREDRYQYHRR